MNSNLSLFPVLRPLLETSEPTFHWFLTRGSCEPVNHIKIMAHWVKSILYKAEKFLSRKILLVQLN